LWIFILIGITFGFYKPLAAGAGTQLGDPSWDYIFGRQITFRAELESDMAVAEAYFIFSRPEDIEANRVSAALDEQGSLIYDYDFMRFPLRAFSHLEFWFEVVVDSGEIFRSSTGVFEYEDNRFDWKDMRSGLFHVHWYEGDEAFGQEMLDVADKGLQQARNWLPVAASDLINIYAYASAQEIRSNILLAGTK